MKIKQFRSGDPDRPQNAVYARFRGRSSSPRSLPVLC